MFLTEKTRNIVAGGNCALTNFRRQKTVFNCFNFVLNWLILKLQIKILFRKNPRGGFSGVDRLVDTFSCIVLQSDRSHHTT